MEDPTAVECICLFPAGNALGEWHCLSLDTNRVIKRRVRESDIAPMPVSGNIGFP